MTTQELENVVAECTTRLQEHFDAVQILVSLCENGVTGGIKRGAGNWYARQGMAHEFINQDVAQENAHQIVQALP